MKKFGLLQHHNGLTFPLSSMHWPSFQSYNIEQSSKRVLQCQTPEFRPKQYEEDNINIPSKLEQLCSLDNYKHTRKYYFRKYEKQQILLIFITYLMKIILIVFTILIPYICFKDQSQIQICFSFFFPLSVLEFSLMIGKYVLKNFQRRKINYFKNYRILIYVAALIIQSIPLYFMMLYYLFIRGLNDITKILSLIVKSSQLLKLILLVAFHCHLFACLWGFEEPFASYEEALVFSFEKFFFQETIVINNNLQVLNYLTNLILLMHIIYCMNEFQITNKSNIKLYFQSSIIPLSHKLLLFHYYKLQNSQQKVEQLNFFLEIIKLRVLERQLKQFNFIDVEQISDQGQIYIASVKNFIKNQSLNQNLNGLYIILQGQININFLGNEAYSSSCSSKQIVELSLIEIFYNQESCISLKGEQEVMYFFIEKSKLVDIFLNSPKKVQLTNIQELYHMIKDKINYYNCTKSLGIRCFFCNEFHPRCPTFNPKLCLTSQKIVQERNCSYVRKKIIKTKSGIYYQVLFPLIQMTNGGSSIQNRNNQDDSSDSFEAFSEFSSDLQISIQGLTDGQLFKQQSLIPSEKKIQKEQQLQIDYISDKMTEPIVSSSLMRNLLPVNSPSSPGEVIRHPVQMPFQDFESLLDIDKWQDFNNYNTDYNLTNIIKKVNQ